MRPDLGIAIRLFLTFGCLYAACVPGHIGSPDGAMMLSVTRSLAEGHVAVEPLPNWPGFGGLGVTDPRTGREVFYSKYGIGQSLAALPAYLLGRSLAPLHAAGERHLFEPRTAPDGAAGPLRANPLRVVWYRVDREHFEGAFAALAASWTNAWVSALTLVALALATRRLEFSWRAALGVVAVVGIASPVFTQATTFFSEPLAALGLTGFFALAVGRPRGRAAWALAGVALGLVVLSKLAFALLLPVAGAYAAWVNRRQDGGFEWRPLLALAGGVVPALAVVAVYNHARFGSVSETGYGDEVSQWTTPFAEGFAGLLASPGRGLLVYAPFVIASLLVGSQLARSRRAEMVFVVGSLLVLLAGFATWHAWEGGWCWGPRFLAPVVPLLALPLAPWFDGRHRPRTAVRRAAAACLAASVVVSLGSLCVHYGDYHTWLTLAFREQSGWFAQRGFESFDAVVRWDWAHAPVVRWWTFPVRDPWLLPHAVRAPGLVLACQATFAIGFLASAGSLARAYVSLRRAECG